MPGTTAGELCEASAFLPLALRSEVLQTYPTADRRLVADELVCALGAHGGDEHYAVVYDHFPAEIPGALWTRWHTGAPPDTFWLRPDCPTRSPSAAACGHFEAHPGPHTWETDEQGRQALSSGLLPSRPPSSPGRAARGGPPACG